MKVFPGLHLYLWKDVFSKVWNEICQNLETSHQTLRLNISQIFFGVGALVQRFLVQIQSEAKFSCCLHIPPSWMSTGKEPRKQPSGMTDISYKNLYLTVDLK